MKTIGFLLCFFSASALFTQTITIEQKDLLDYCNKYEVWVKEQKEISLSSGTQYYTFHTYYLGYEVYGEIKRSTDEVNKFILKKKDLTIYYEKDEYGNVKSSYSKQYGKSGKLSLSKTQRYKNFFDSALYFLMKDLEDFKKDNEAEMANNK